MLDHPGNRSLHAVPVPRTGGLVIHGVLLGLAALAALWNANELPVPLLAGWLLVLAVSVLDDVRDVSAAARLLTHFVAVGIVVGFTGAEPILLSAFVVIVLVWGINLFNFMDGMDGLAGAMALIGAAGLALLGWIAGDRVFALQALAIAGAATGFLTQNLPPARLFMGDTGSVGLGYLLAALSYLGATRGLFPWQVPVLLFLPFLVDATLTLLLRLMRRKKVWQAHREHIYQRLVLKGWRVWQVLALESVIMGFCALMSVMAVTTPVDANHALIGATVVLLAAYVLGLRYTRAGPRA